MLLLRFIINLGKRQIYIVKEDNILRDSQIKTSK